MDKLHELRAIMVLMVLVMLVTGCAKQNNECELIDLDSYKGIIIRGIERTQFSAEYEFNDELDSEMFGIWVAENADNPRSPIGETYVFFKDGSYFKTVRLYSGEALIYSGTYYMIDNYIYITDSTEGYELKLKYEIDNNILVIYPKEGAAPGFVPVVYNKIIGE